MSRHVDKFFSALPFFFIAYHIFSISRSFDHLTILIKITVNYFLSYILKRIYKKTRRQKDYVNKEWTIPEKLKVIKSHYSFPSSHGMFFAKYLFLFPSVGMFILAFFGMGSRIYYQHHTTKEVVAAVGFVMIVEFALRAFFRAM